MASISSKQSSDNCFTLSFNVIGDQSVFTAATEGVKRWFDSPVFKPGFIQSILNLSETSTASGKVFLIVLSFLLASSFE